MGFFFVRSFFGYQNNNKKKTGSKVSLVCVAPGPLYNCLFFSSIIRSERKSWVWLEGQQVRRTDREPYNEMTKASGVDVDFICRLRVAEGKWTLPVDSTHTTDKQERKRNSNTRNHIEQEKIKKQNKTERQQRAARPVRLCPRPCGLFDYNQYPGSAFCY